MLETDVLTTEVSGWPKRPSVPCFLSDVGDNVLEHGVATRAHRRGGSYRS